jgi:predicted lipoprotein with Yx(FWY)xxD motif
MRLSMSAIVAAAALLSAGAAFAAGEPPPTPTEVSVFAQGDGYVYKNIDGKAIYTNARDAAGRSNCVAASAKAWPPLLAPADARPVGDWTPIRRPDSNSHQWAYKGRPVYTCLNDDETLTSGDGIGGVWKRLVP